ncbi:hypothetical protein P20311_0350 [Pseudoalteromonas sp. BSi20311]|nr:hypothetical protein P20311_0350 [Pseudoalteromonas sp. BSi20311]
MLPLWLTIKRGNNADKLITYSKRNTPQLCNLTNKALARLHGCYFIKFKLSG